MPDYTIEVSRSTATLGSSGAATTPQTNHQIDTGHLHARRRLGQPAELHVLQFHVAQRAGVFVLEMVVRSDVGIEPGAFAIDTELPDEALGGEQIQRVVYRRLGSVSYT